MSGDALPILTIAVTLAAAAMILATPPRLGHLLGPASLMGGAATFGLVVAMGLGVAQGATFETRIAFLPEADLVLQTDALSMLFATLSATLWMVTTVYAVGYLRDGPNRGRFFGAFAVCVSATMGVALAGNLVTFLVFFELLTLATYPLVTHRGDEASIRAGRLYLAYTLGGGAALLTGAVWLHALGAPGAFVVGGALARAPDALAPWVATALFALLVGGVGVKAALAPAHGWLPTAMVAPAPVSALLHAVAVVKTGAFGIVRIVFDVYGVGYAEGLGVLTLLAALAAATILWGSILALGQDDLKRRLAYSTVSQVSYIALGAALASPMAAVGGIMHLIHQGVMKITLFFCAGAFAEGAGVKTVSAMDGMGARMPWVMGAFTVAALGMIGLPPTAGFITKWHLAGGGAETGQWWVLGVLLASSALNAAYFLPILRRAWFAPPPDGAGRVATPWALAAPPVITAALTLAAALFATSIVSPLGWTRTLVLAEFGFAPP